MSLQDALPDRPLLEEEIYELQEQLPEGYQAIPTSIIDSGTGEDLVPTLHIKEPDGTFTLFGRSMKEGEWVKIKSWSEEEYSSQASNDAIGEFSAKHFTGEYSETRVDLGRD